MARTLAALETAHAVAFAADLARQMRPDQSLVICLSGRGDKDMETVSGLLNPDRKDRK